ncbi:hypothetical protein JCM18237_04910 [Halorubrum luteum]
MRVASFPAGYMTTDQGSPGSSGDTEEQADSGEPTDSGESVDRGESADRAAPTDTGVRTDRADPVDRQDPIESEYDGVIGEIERAIRYPAEGDEFVKTILIGGLLSLFSVLIVPLFLLAGYVVHVLDRTADGDETPPTFDEWGELAVTGIKAVVIGFAYTLVPAIVGGLIVLVGIVGIGAGGDGALAGLGVLGILVGGFVWFALAIVVAYLLPAAVANFAQERSIGSGFDVARLKTIWLSRSYAIAWGTMVLVLVIGGFVAAILNVVPVLGTIVGAFVGFHFGIAAYSVIGRSWHEFPVDGGVEQETTVSSVAGR